MKSPMLWMALAGLLVALPFASAPLAHADDDDKGKIMSLTYEDAPIATVISEIARLSGRNIVFGKNVTGNVTLTLTNVGWKEALELLAKTHGLKLETKGGITVITKPAGTWTPGKSKSAKLAEIKRRKAEKEASRTAREGRVKRAPPALERERAIQRGKTWRIVPGWHVDGQPLKTTKAQGTFKYVVVPAADGRVPAETSARIRDAQARILNYERALRYLKAADAEQEVKRVEKQVEREKKKVSTMRAALAAERKALATKYTMATGAGRVTTRPSSPAALEALHGEVKALRAEVRELTGLVRQLVEKQPR